jgi:hypothetical protein
MGTCDEVGLSVNVSRAGEPVRIQLFTTAYRKVAETVRTTLPVGVSPVKVVLRDMKGKRLSNGVYYVRLVTGDAESIGKLVVLK